MIIFKNDKIKTWEKSRAIWRGLFDGNKTNNKWLLEI